MIAVLGMMPRASHAQDALDAGMSAGGAATKPAHRPKKPAPAPKPAPKPFEAGRPPVQAQGAAAGRQMPPGDVHRFESWIVSCAQKQAATDPANCLGLVSVARDKQDQRKIVIMGITKNKGVMSFFAQTPTAVELKSGVDIQFEGRAPRHFDYSSCEPALCTTILPLDDALLNELVTAPNVTMVWTSLEAGQVKVVFSPAGAREAFEYLRAQ
jgi:invasion protein IalB